MNRFGRKITESLICLLLLPTLAEAQAHVCYVRYSYLDLKTQVRSSFFSLGQFPISFGDESVTKSFRHDESNVTVNVGVEYPTRSIGNENAGLILALALSGKPEDVFDEIGRVRAQATGRDPLKGSLMISKSVADNAHIWTFYLSCVPKKPAHRSRRHAQQIVGR